VQVPHLKYLPKKQIFLDDLQLISDLMSVFVDILLASILYGGFASSGRAADISSGEQLSLIVRHNVL
jgi:hypothetical protein